MRGRVRGCVRRWQDVLCAVFRGALEGPHKRLRAGEIHRSLRMRCTGECEQKKARRHDTNGLAKAALERLGGLTDGNLGRQPKGTGIQSESTAESIHFCTSADGCRQLWRKTKRRFASASNEIEVRRDDADAYRSLYRLKKRESNG